MTLAPPPAGRAAQALVLGLAAQGACQALGLLLPWGWGWLAIPGQLALALLALTGPRWARRSYWVGFGLLWTLWLVVATTSLPFILLRQLALDDPLVPADVVVVLSANTFHDMPTTPSVDRLLTGLRLLHQGVAPRLVCTGEPANPRNQFAVLGPRLATEVGLAPSPFVPFEAVPVSPMTTYTEALSVRQMAARYGWRRIRLVTSPAHTGRARAVFRQVGLDTLVTAARPSQYDPRGGRDAGQRFVLFSQCVYELVGQAYYRWRGRI